MHIADLFARAECDIRSIFYASLTGLNSMFPKTSCHTKEKDQVCSTIYS